MDQGQSHLPLVVTVTHSVGSAWAVRARRGQPPHCTPKELWSLLCSLWHVFVCGNPGQRHTSSSCPFAAVTVLCQVPLALTPPDSCKTRSSHHPAVGSVCCCSCCWFVSRPRAVPRVPPPAVTRPEGRTGSVSRFPTYSPHLVFAAAPEQSHGELLGVPWPRTASLLPSSRLCAGVEGFLGAAQQHLHLHPPLTFWKGSSARDPALPFLKIALKPCPSSVAAGLAACALPSSLRPYPGAGGGAACGRRGRLRVAMVNEEDANLHV